MIPVRLGSCTNHVKTRPSTHFEEYNLIC